MFIDEAKISIKAGHGGSGAVSFRREKYVPRGGPDGGNGGDGGNIIFIAQKGESTLTRYRYNRLFRAERGGQGEGRNRHGKNGEDVILQVPCGTVIKDRDSGEVLADLTEDRQEFVAAHGGRGGKGNEHFKSSTFQAPKFSQEGEKGEERELLLELKLLADVGLVGLPNAGKSTLISRLTHAHPKIADYPFTTIHPKIGVVESDEDSFVMADMPGLIKGAHEGKGLGTKFLKHIERTAVICHLVDGADGDTERMAGEVATIEEELEGYDPTLLEKRQLLVITKTDAIHDPALLQKAEEEMRKTGLEVLSISSVKGDGLESLRRRLMEAVKQSRKEREERE